MAERTKSKTRGRSSSNGRVKPAELVRDAAKQLAELTGRPPEKILGVEKDGDSWKISFELTELQRVPNSTDLMACYVVEVDDDGELVGYHRGERYLRGQPDGGGR